MIYLDYSATTPVLPEVLDSYNRVTTEYFGNPNSLHNLGLKSRNLLESARKQVGETVAKAIVNNCQKGLFVVSLTGKLTEGKFRSQGNILFFLTKARVSCS